LRFDAISLPARLVPGGRSLFASVASAAAAAAAAVPSPRTRGAHSRQSATHVDAALPTVRLWPDMSGPQNTTPTVVVKYSKFSTTTLVPSVHGDQSAQLVDQHGKMRRL